MKNRILIFLLTIVLVTTLPLCCFASDYYYITDEADLLTPQEEQTLEDMSSLLSFDYNIEVGILTIASTDGKTIEAFADDYFEENYLTEDGLLFVIAMDQREWHISTSGSAIYALSDRTLDELGGNAAQCFSQGEFYEGFEGFLQALPQYFGEPEDISFFDFGYVLLMGLPVGLIVAAIALLIMRGMMNTKRRQYSASDYMKQGSYSLKVQQDLFLYSNVSKTAKQTNTSSGSGSTTHKSSSGHTHGGRGGKF